MDRFKVGRTVDQDVNTVTPSSTETQMGTTVSRLDGVARERLAASGTVTFFTILISTAHACATANAQTAIKIKKRKQFPDFKYEVVIRASKDGSLVKSLNQFSDTDPEKTPHHQRDYIVELPGGKKSTTETDFGGLASEELRSDKAFILAAATYNDISLLDFASQNLRVDADFCSQVAMLPRLRRSEENAKAELKVAKAQLAVLKANEAETKKQIKKLTTRTVFNVETDKDEVVELSLEEALEELKRKRENEPQATATAASSRIATGAAIKKIKIERNEAKEEALDQEEERGYMNIHSSKQTATIDRLAQLARDLGADPATIKEAAKVM
eukprot:gene8105-4553_t